MLETIKESEAQFRVLQTYYTCALTHETCHMQSRPLSLGQLRREPQPEKTDSNYIESHSDSMYSSRRIHRERSRIYL